MHTLLCILTRICGICNVVCCIASGIHMKSFPGNFLGSDLMTSEWALVLNYYVPIPCPRVQEAQVWHSEHFSIPLLDSVLASSGSEEHHLSVTLSLVYRTLRTIYASLHQQSLFCVHHIFCRQTFLKIELFTL